MNEWRLTRPALDRLLGWRHGHGRRREEIRADPPRPHQVLREPRLSHPGGPGRPHHRSRRETHRRRCGHLGRRAGDVLLRRRETRSARVLATEQRLVLGAWTATNLTLNADRTVTVTIPVAALPPGEHVLVVSSANEPLGDYLFVVEKKISRTP